MVKKFKNVWNYYRMSVRRNKSFADFEREIREIDRIEVEVNIYYICALCLSRKQEDGGKLEYMRPKDDNTLNLTMCCEMLVCRDCCDRNLLTRCHVCSKNTEVGWQTKGGSV